METKKERERRKKEKENVKKKCINGRREEKELEKANFGLPPENILLPVKTLHG